MKTYDVYFNNSESSNNKGFKETYEYCLDWITRSNFENSNLSYFPDYKGGTVSIVCNETEETVYETKVL